jgi:hypothetical protein
LIEDRFNLRGRLEIDQSLLTEDLSLFFFENHSLSLSDANAIGARKTLHLHPLSRSMLRSGSGADMRAGIKYSISGTNVGALTHGPVGHPGDGEYDYYPIKRFEVVASFTRDLLYVQLEGVTEIGRSGFQDLSDQSRPPLHSCRFNVSFFVPRGEMKLFFGFGEHDFPYFEKALDEQVSPDV